MSLSPLDCAYLFSIAIFFYVDIKDREMPYKNSIWETSMAVFAQTMLSQDCPAPITRVSLALTIYILIQLIFCIVIYNRDGTVLRLCKKLIFWISDLIILAQLLGYWGPYFLKR